MLPLLYKSFTNIQNATHNNLHVRGDNAMKVGDIMSLEPQCCGINTSLDEIASKMWEFNCGAIPVVDDNHQPTGLITDRDITMCCTLNHKAPWELQASTITGNRELFICSQEDDIDIAMAIMKDKKVRRLPVTDKDGYLTGILSIDDIVARSNKTKTAKALSYDTTMNTLKAVGFQH